MQTIAVVIVALGISYLIAALLAGFLIFLLSLAGVYVGGNMWIWGLIIWVLAIFFKKA